jgi:hypothetical protein
MGNIRDFYMVDDLDPDFVPDQAEVYNDLEAAINQVKLTLLTKKGEVLGELNFGLDIEKYLFEFEMDPFGLAEDANSQVQTYVSEARKRALSLSPGYITDDKDRKIYILQILVDEQKTPFAILYD